MPKGESSSLSNQMPCCRPHHCHMTAALLGIRPASSLMTWPPLPSPSPSLASHA